MSSLNSIFQIRQNNGWLGILLKEAQPKVFADLGYGVLDAATVETAAYCLTKAVV